jgi:hypothetical protein
MSIHSAPDWGQVRKEAEQRSAAAAAALAPGPKPGDWFVVDPGTEIDEWIIWAEKLADGRKTKYSHAGVFSRYAYPALRLPEGELGAPWTTCGPEDKSATMLIVEAEPGGAREVPWHYDGQPARWSCERFPNNPRVADMARALVGTPYSIADYAALISHRWHIPSPGLKDFIGDTGHMICSQLVDQACYDALWFLFDDDRWPGYVKPSDLGHLLD